MDYNQIAKDIVRLVGGPDNVKRLNHCMTRLRFSLKDSKIAQEDELKKLKGVLTVKDANGQYQVVVGQEVNAIYKEIMTLYNFGSDGEVEEDGADEKASKSEGSQNKFKKIGSGILDYITGTMTQLIPILIGAGLIMMIPILGSRYFGLDKTSSTYIVLLAAANSTFYFLPVFVGFAAARKLNCNPYMAGLIGLFVLNPNIVNLVSSGKPTDLFGVNFPALSYASTIIPVLLSTYVYNYIETLLYKKLPTYIKSTFAPFISLLIMIPFVLYISGPIGYYAGNALVQAILFLNNSAGWLATGVLAGCLSLIVMVGAHTILVPVMIQLIASVGYDGFIRPAFVVGAFAALGATLAVALRTKNKSLRGISVGAAVSQFFGVGEPALYAVMLPLKKPLIASIISSFAGGILSSALGCKAISMGSNGIFGILLFGSDIPKFALVCAVTAILSFMLTIILKFDDSKISK